MISGLRTMIGGNLIHDGLDLSVYRNEVVGIVGGSGSGKSVLLRVVLGLLPATFGSVEIFGQNRTALRGIRRARLDRRMGVLFQDGALFTSLTVAENIELPLREHTDLSPSLRYELARIKIRLAGLPPDTADKHPSELSGGMRKRAALARALALDPEILFLDEPTAGLDPLGASAFDQLVSDLRRGFGLSVVMVTHDLDSLITIADRIAVLVDRRVIVGTINELLAVGHPWIDAYFLGRRGRAARDHS